jgi:restriction endonuclease Mrr
MPIPNDQTYMRLLLEVLADGVKKKLPEIVSEVINKFSFTQEH